MSRLVWLKTGSLDEIHEREGDQEVQHADSLEEINEREVDQEAQRVDSLDEIHEREADQEVQHAEKHADKQTVFKKMKKKFGLPSLFGTKRAKELEQQQTLVTTLIEEEPLVNIDDRKFPQSVVKAWKDITIERELGVGQFGKVYKGFLHLGKYQR